MTATYTKWQTVILWRTPRKRWVSLCSSKKHPESCCRDAPDNTSLISWNCKWYFSTDNTEVEVKKGRDFRISYVNTVYHVSESTSYKGPKSWEIGPVKTNESISLNSFINEIRIWVPQNCPCRLRKQYMSGVSFLPWCLVVFFLFRVLALLFIY